MHISAGVKRIVVEADRVELVAKDAFVAGALRSCRPFAALNCRGEDFRLAGNLAGWRAGATALAGSTAQQGDSS